jgi:hydrogenase large subunit
MAAAKNVGNAFGFNVHYEDGGGWTDPANDITEAGNLVRDVAYGSNMIASHIVHFYQLAALDFLDTHNIQLPAGLGGGMFNLNKPPLCPNFSPGTGDPKYGYYYRIPPLVTTYLVAQYVISLKIRRMCNQIGGIWSGRAPFIQGLTPGGVATSVSYAAIQKTRELLYEGGVGGTPAKDYPNPGDPGPAPNTILKFIGNVTDLPNWVASAEPKDFTTFPIVGDGSTAYGGSMMFDVFALALFYPDYFWFGNAYERFLAYGVFERGDETNPSGDKRLLCRGRKRSAQQAATRYPAVHTEVFENIQSSYYKYTAPGNLKWRHPWYGQTDPRVARPGAYSWVKSPRYRDTLDPDYSPLVPHEVGPLARMVVNGDYYAGVLSDVYNSIVLNRTIPLGPFSGANIPQWNADGPNLGAVFGAGYPDLGPAPGWGLKYRGDSALDRYAARQYEAEKIAKAMVGWLDRLQAMVGHPTNSITSHTKPIPSTRKAGYGWTEAPRGALGHWVVVNSGKIEKYQCVVPSTWNASPMDSLGRHGPAEKAMENIFVKHMDYPLEVMRVSHSWDFCTACAVHLVKRNDKGEVEEENTVTIEPTHP